MGVTAEGEESSTTKSAIANGTIEIRNNPNQDISDLSRDTANLLNKLDQIFEKATVEEQKELANKFGEVAYEGIHWLGKEMGWKDGSPEKQPCMLQ